MDQQRDEARSEEDLTAEEQEEAARAEAARELKERRFRGALSRPWGRSRVPPASEVEDVAEWVRGGGRIERCPPRVASGAVDADAHRPHRKQGRFDVV